MTRLGRLVSAAGLVTAFTSCMTAYDPVGAAEEELTYAQTVEAEGATGAGADVIDATASAGALHRNSVVGTTAYRAFTTTGSVTTAIVRARRGSGTCSPILAVRIDSGTEYSMTVGSGSWIDYPVSLTAGAGAHSLALKYRSGAAGCALDVDVATLTVFEPDPPPPPPLTLTLESEYAVGSGTAVGDASASNGQARRFDASLLAATSTITTTGTLLSGSVRVRGGACSPWGRVRIDGVDAWPATPVTSASYTVIPLSVLPLPAGTHTVEVYARYIPSAACPIRFDKVTLVTAAP